MITQKHLFAVLGFATVAAWIAFGFGNAVLCLLGAAAFYALGAVAEGKIDLGELQQRMQGGAAAPPAPPAFPRDPRVR